MFLSVIDEAQASMFLLYLIISCGVASSFLPYDIYRALNLVTARDYANQRFWREETNQYLHMGH